MGRRAAYGEWGRPVLSRWVQLGWGLVSLILLAVPVQLHAGGILEATGAQFNGYIDNFTILRNDTFARDYHVASSRYRADLQITGKMPSSLFGNFFDRVEYFFEVRPEYQSIYDISPRFGDRTATAVSGRGAPVRGSNAGLLQAFGFQPRDFEAIYPHTNLVITHPINPDVSYLRKRTEENVWYDHDASLNDLRLGKLESTNWDIYYPIREAYLDFYFDALGGVNWLRLGRQQIVWGKADFFRLQDVVNPVNFGDHFFIDAFDDTRIPLWAVQFEHRFGDVGPFSQLAGNVVWVPDRYRPLAFGAPEQPWAIGFGRELDAFAFGNDLFGELIFPGENINSSFGREERVRWNLKNSGIGTKWQWLLGNVRFQFTDWFAYQDVPAFGWTKLHVLEIPGCAEVLPAIGAPGGGRTVMTNPAATQVALPVRVNVDPNKIRMAQAGAVADVPDVFKDSVYINRCGLTGELVARYRKQNTLGLSWDWFEPRTGIVIRSENSWTPNALVTDTTQPDWLNTSDIVRWLIGIDRPTMIRTLNPYRSFFLSAQAFGTHLLDVKAGRRGNPNGSNDNFIFTALALTQYWRDQLNVLVFGAYGTTGKDGTVGGNVEYLLTNHWSAQLGVTGFLGTRQEHDIGPFANFTTDGRPFTETGFGIGHMQAGGSERNQMDEFWGRVRYRF